MVLAAGTWQNLVTSSSSALLSPKNHARKMSRRPGKRVPALPLSTPQAVFGFVFAANCYLLSDIPFLSTSVRKHAKAEACRAELRRRSVLAASLPLQRPAYSAAQRSGV